MISEGTTHSEIQIQDKMRGSLAESFLLFLWIFLICTIVFFLVYTASAGTANHHCGSASDGRFGSASRLPRGWSTIHMVYFAWIHMVFSSFYTRYQTHLNTQNTSKPPQVASGQQKSGHLSQQFWGDYVS